MDKDEFDYYIFIDYSENLLGYILLSKENFNRIQNNLSKLKHYTEVRHKKPYIDSMKKLFEKNKILDSLDKYRIVELRQNVEMCSEIFDFCKRNSDSRFFISVDDRQYRGFMNLSKIIDGKKFCIIKEGKLKKGSKEYQTNKIIDTLLNIKRRIEKSK